MQRAVHSGRRRASMGIKSRTKLWASRKQVQALRSPKLRPRPPLLSSWSPIQTVRAASAPKCLPPPSRCRSSSPTLLLSFVLNPHLLQFDARLYTTVPSAQFPQSFPVPPIPTRVQHPWSRSSQGEGGRGRSYKAREVKEPLLGPSLTTEERRVGRSLALGSCNHRKRSAGTLRQQMW